MLLASRGLRGGFRAFKFRTTFSCIAGRGWSSSEVVGERGQSGVFDAILVARSPVGTMKSLVDDARKTLTDAVKVDELHIKKGKDEMLVGNLRGLDLANLSHRLDTELAGLKKKMAEEKAELDLTVEKMAGENAELDLTVKKIAGENAELDLTVKKMAEEKAELDLTVRSQEERLRYLLRSDDCYKQVRNRYLSTFKRDFLKTHTATDQKIIDSGNLTAHWGDAVVDASLYTEPNGRTDFEVFRRLYGILPEKMEKIGHDETIHALDTHAGILGWGSGGKTRKSQVTTAFTRFIQAFEKSGFDESYLHTKDSEVARAYKAFVKCSASKMKKRARPGGRY